jgi:Transposase and inactivated derivatives
MKSEEDEHMSKYDKQFKEEAVRLAKEIGSRKAAEQLGIPFYTLIDWRSARRQHGDKAYVGSGHSYADADKSPREMELERENAELRRANEILKDALGFFAKDRKK